MALRSCERQGCTRGTERICGGCMICSGHFCAEHFSAPSHSCPAEDRNPEAFNVAYQAAQKRLLLELLTKINVGELVRLARGLRPGIGCTVPALIRDGEPYIDQGMVSNQMGGMNAHLDIKFEDGVVWLARIRLDDPMMPPMEVKEFTFESEVATLQFLGKTQVPTPELFYSAGYFAQDAVGVPFTLFQKLPGSALDWYNASATQRTKVMEKLVDIFLELEKHPFECTGSLYPPNSDDVIGGFAQELLFKSDRGTLGPYKSLESPLREMIRHHMDLVAAGEIAGPRVDKYLALQWQLGMIPRLLASVSSTGPFFLKHFEDKGDHILIDDEYNITGIIDWEFASTECKAYAFSSPCMMWPVAEYYDGKNELSPDELEFADMFKARGRGDMAEIVLNGRKIQRFLFFTGGGGATSSECEALFQGLRAALAVEGDEPIESYEEWKQKAIVEYGKTDLELQRLVSEAGQSKLDP